MTEGMTQIERARNARISRNAVAASRGIGAEERQIGGPRP